MVPAQISTTMDQFADAMIITSSVLIAVSTIAVPTGIGASVGYNLMSSGDPIPGLGIAGAIVGALVGSLLPAFPTAIGFYVAKYIM